MTRKRDEPVTCRRATLTAAADKTGALFVGIDKADWEKNYPPK